MYGVCLRCSNQNGHWIGNIVACEQTVKAALLAMYCNVYGYTAVSPTAAAARSTARSRQSRISSSQTLNPHGSECRTGPTHDVLFPAVRHQALGLGAHGGARLGTCRTVGQQLGHPRGRRSSQTAVRYHVGVGRCNSPRHLGIGEKKSKANEMLVRGALATSQRGKS